MPGRSRRRPSAGGIIAATTSTRTSTTTRSSTRSPTGPSCSSTAGRSTAATDEHASYAHGTKGSAVISESGHMPSKCRMFKNQDMQDANITWACREPEPNPYQTEWDDLIAAIREDKPYNETERGTEASLQAVLGRMAAHTGPRDHARRAAEGTTTSSRRTSTSWRWIRRRRCRPTRTDSIRFRSRERLSIENTNRSRKQMFTTTTSHDSRVAIDRDRVRRVVVVKVFCTEYSIMAKVESGDDWLGVRGRVHSDLPAASARPRSWPFAGAMRPR